MRNTNVNFCSARKRPLNLCVIILSLLFSHIASAQTETQQQWWFNVEFIAFKRDLLPTNTEDFNHTNFPIDTRNGIDLFSLASIKQSQTLSGYLRAMPLCQDLNKARYPNFMPFTAIEYRLTPQTEIKDEVNQIDTIFTTLDLNNIRLQCLSINEHNSLLSFTRQPTAIAKELFAASSGEPIAFLARPQLIDKNAIALSDYAKKVFRQRDISPLIHTAWRQEVLFGVDNAPYFKIVAGELLTSERPLQFPPPDTVLADQAKQTNEPEGAPNNIVFFEDLRQQLNAGKPVDWLSLSSENEQDALFPVNDEQTEWELEGLFKVYLEYVNQVPYLHIESEFKHHRLSLNSEGDAKIEVYPFKQRRRIISKQIHYFDHPAFGIIVRLERFTPPISEVSLTELLGQ